MKRRLTALGIILLLPFIYVVALYFINKNIQPQLLNVAHSDKPEETVYFNISKIYALTGDIVTFPGVLLEPDAGADAQSYNFVSAAKSRYDFFYANSMSDCKRTSCVVGEDYVMTVAFNAKLPTDTEYTVWFPSEFCEYKVFVNGKITNSSPTFKSDNPRFGQDFTVVLPASKDGCYSVVMQIISPSVLLAFTAFIRSL